MVDNDIKDWLWLIVWLIDIDYDINESEIRHDLLLHWSTCPNCFNHQKIKKIHNSEIRWAESIKRSFLNFSNHYFVLRRSQSSYMYWIQRSGVHICETVDKKVFQITIPSSPASLCSNSLSFWSNSSSSSSEISCKSNQIVSGDISSVTAIFITSSQRMDCLENGNASLIFFYQFAHLLQFQYFSQVSRGETERLILIFKKPYPFKKERYFVKKKIHKPGGRVCRISQNLFFSSKSGRNREHL